MQGLAFAITTDHHVFPTFITPRIQSLCLKTHLKPTRVCFSNNFGLLLAAGSSSPPRLVTASSSSSSSYVGCVAQRSVVLENSTPKVRKRVEFLIEIESQCEQIKEDFAMMRSALDDKYLRLYQPLFTKRYEIVNDEEEGVRDFWLTVLKNNQVTGKDITVRDEGPLMYLKDIKWNYFEKSYGFKLEFFFDQNPYFNNTVLTKEYYINDEYFNHHHVETRGTRIEWYPGNSLDPKNATKTQDFENFFSFFSPAQYGTRFYANKKDRSYDFEIAITIKHKIIPHAVSWFTKTRTDMNKCVELLCEIQKKYDKLEAKYMDKRAALEAKYHNLYQSLYTKRYEIVNGLVEPPGQEEDKLAEEKGVPDFWLRVLKRNAYTYDEVNKRDEGALKYLKDIKWSSIEEPTNWCSMPEKWCRMPEEPNLIEIEFLPEKPKWIKIEFFFDQNPYFKNTVLTKIYHIIDGSSYLVVDKAIGTKIEWYPGNCLTMRTEDDEAKFVSFFNFFSPPSPNGEGSAVGYKHEILQYAVSLFLQNVPDYGDISSSDETDDECEDYEGDNGY